MHPKYYMYTLQMSLPTNRVQKVYFHFHHAVFTSLFTSIYISKLITLAMPKTLPSQKQELLEVLRRP